MLNDVRAFKQNRINQQNTDGIPSSNIDSTGVGANGDILDVYIENGEYSVSDTGLITLTSGAQ